MLSAEDQEHSVLSPQSSLLIALMRILGIDPGIAQTGFGLIDETEGQLRLVTYGVIQTEANTPIPRRLQQIYQELTGVIETYGPQAAAIEELYFGRNVTSAIKVGQALGVILLAMANANLNVVRYSPPKIKETVTGYGNADKAQVQLMVRHTLDLEETPHPDHAADSLAVAITHAHYQHFASLTNE